MDIELDTNKIDKQGDTTPAPPSSPSHSPAPMDLQDVPINDAHVPPPEPEPPKVEQQQYQQEQPQPAVTNQDTSLMDRIESATDLPMQSLEKLEEMLNRPRWVVPVLPGQDLEVLMLTCISMANRGLPDTEAVARFISGSLTTSFQRLMNDDAVRDWKTEIQKCIYNCSEKFIQLFVLKMHDADEALFDILSHVFNPKSKYHMHNVGRQVESSKDADLPSFVVHDTAIHAYGQKGYLLDLINAFGRLGGFEKLVNMFASDSQIEFSCQKLCSILRPFGLCQQYLVDDVIKNYLNPALDLGILLVEKVTDEELKKEAKKEPRENGVYELVTQLRNLVSREKDNRAMPVQQLRLKIILRMLTVSSFAGRVNALNEIYNILSENHAGQFDATNQQQEMAQWLLANQFLKLCLKDNLHQQTYVDRLEKILRRLLTLKVMQNEHLAQLWDAHCGKHDVIQNNVHGILAKMAWEFTPAQLDYLFTRFTQGMKEADLKQRQKLLELMRKLAEDDKAGHMAKKVLQLLWNIANDREIPQEVAVLALDHHLKILDQSCYGKRDEAKHEWVSICVKEVSDNDALHSLLPLKQMQAICMLFNDNSTYSYMKSNTTSYRAEIVSRMQQEHQLVAQVTTNLGKYMNIVRKMDPPPDTNPTTWYPDGRYSHEEQLNERLRFIKFLLTEGNLWMCDTQASQLWDSLICNPVIPPDKDTGFRMFTELLNPEADQDLDPEETKKFFEEKVVHFEPSALSRWGWLCFDRFFRSVNLKDGNLVCQRRGTPMINAADLTGQDYFWRVILHAPDDVAVCAIDSFREIYSNPTDEFSHKLSTLHEGVIEQCMNTMKANYETLTTLANSKEVNAIRDLTSKINRVLLLLAAYVGAYDESLLCDNRVQLPLWRSSVGRTVVLVVRIQAPQGKTSIDHDDSLVMHSNNTVADMKKIINSSALKLGHAPNALHKFDVYVNNDTLDPCEDSKTLGVVCLMNENIVELRLSCGTNASSPESSGESSPIHDRRLDERNEENNLPGVIIANKYEHIKLLFDIADIGCRLEFCWMTQSARRLLDWLPAVIEERRVLGRICSQEPCADLGLQGVFFDKSPSRVLYCLSLLYSMLFPSHTNEMSADLLVNSYTKGGLKVCLAMLSQNNFLHGTDHETKALANYHLMLLLKMYLYISVRLSLCWKEEDLRLSPDLPIAEVNDRKKWIAALKEIADQVPNDHESHMLREAAAPAITVLCEQRAVLETYVFDVVEATHVTSVMRLIWVTGCGNPRLTTKDFNEEIEKAYNMKHQLSPRDTDICYNGLEALCLMLCMCPTAINICVLKDKNWKLFIKHIIFSNSMNVREQGAEMFMLIADKMCCLDHQLTVWFIQLLFAILCTTTNNTSVVDDNVDQCQQYFDLLCNLLSALNSRRQALNNGENLLCKELDWLNKAHVYTQDNLESFPLDILLYGHLRITRELIRFLPTERLLWYGSNPNGPMIIKQMLDDFLLPSSRLFAEQRKTGNNVNMHRSHTMTWQEPNAPPPDPNTQTMSRSKTTICNAIRVVPVCGTQESMREGYQVLVALCRNCPANLAVVSKALIDLYFADAPTNDDWDYAPNMALRGRGAFVGLKNAGATCYMNSVFQQLFMVNDVRVGILNADVPGVEMYDSDSDQLPPSTVDDSDAVGAKKEYHCNILRCVQLMFANLLGSQIQYFIPRKFWKCFRFNNEPLNPREQQDALEFYNAIVDSIDEALKALNQPAICQLTFGGTFADQKICKDCPHRYSREESFTCISVDVRRHNNLLDSLQEYVKGDLLESDNAYLCETCNQKVTAIKRLCIAKLPPVLVMQLKRFDYDWERDQAVKFNDYFHFPTEIDMEPYTVSGVAKMEDDVTEDETSDSGSTRYRLKGIIVHSGQASGGHYYSFLNIKPDEGGEMGEGDEKSTKWYKFDDADVNEFDLDSENEMRNQCYGGEYLNDNFDVILRRSQPRRQKRWWNAYILFYEQIDDSAVDKLTMQIENMSISSRLRAMPVHLEALVRKHNTKFVHERNQYCHEFFDFMLELAKSNLALIERAYREQSPKYDETAVNTLSLAVHFLFTTGFRAKKVLRYGYRHREQRTYLGDWTNTLQTLFNYSATCRKYMAQRVLFSHMTRLSQFLFDCPNQDVRNCFGRILLNLMLLGQQDSVSLNSVPDIVSKELSEPCTLTDVLLVMLKVVLITNHDYTKATNTYFALLHQFATNGPEQRECMLRHGYDEFLCAVLLDEYPDSLRHMHSTETQSAVYAFCLLVNTADITNYRRTVDGQAVENPNGGRAVQLSENVAHKLLCDTNTMTKMLRRLLDQLYSTSGGSTEPLTNEIRVLLHNCCWENMHFSTVLIQSLILTGTHGFSPEARPAMHNLLRLLHELQDSWMTHRIMYLLQGDEKWPGVLGQVDDLKSNPRKVYLIYKLIIQVFRKCGSALRVFRENTKLHPKLIHIYKFLHDEINKPVSTYGYRPPQLLHTSNELSINLERTNSAISLLQETSEFIGALHEESENEEDEAGCSKTDCDVECVDDSKDESVADACMGSTAAPPAHADPPPAYTEQLLTDNLGNLVRAPSQQQVTPPNHNVGVMSVSDGSESDSSLPAELLFPNPADQSVD